MFDCDELFDDVLGIFSIKGRNATLIESFYQIFFLFSSNSLLISRMGFNSKLENASFSLW